MSQKNIETKDNSVTNDGVAEFNIDCVVGLLQPQEPSNTQDGSKSNRWSTLASVSDDLLLASFLD